MRGLGAEVRPRPGRWLTAPHGCVSTNCVSWSRELAATALFVLVVAWGTGAQAATWSPPQALGAPTVNPQDLGLLFANDGSALISFHFARTTALPPAIGRLAVRRSDGTIARVKTMPDDLPAPPVGYGANRVALLRERAVPVATNALEQRVRLSVSRGTVAAPLAGTPVPVAAFSGFAGARPAIAARRDGEVAVAWTQLQPALPAGHVAFIVRVAIERPGQAFGRPRTLASGIRDGSGVVALAYGSDDELVIAYASDRSRRRVIAATVRAADGTFGRAQVLGPREGLDSLAVAAASHGRDVVAWGTQDPGQETSKPWIVRAAARHGRAFGAAQVLDAGGKTFVDLPRRIALGMTRDGLATVAWSNAVGDTYPLRVATSDATGRFASATQLDASGAVGDLALSTRGSTLLSWTSFHGQFGSEQATQVLAALRPAGARAFAAPEVVAAADQVGVDGPRAAFDPRNDVPTVVWPARLTPPTNAVHLAVRAT